MHKQETASLFTKKYKCFSLVYYEQYSRAYDAICREKVAQKNYDILNLDLPSEDDGGEIITQLQDKHPG